MWGSPLHTDLEPQGLLMRAALGPPKGGVPRRFLQPVRRVGYGQAPRRSLRDWVRGAGQHLFRAVRRRRCR